MLRWEIIWFPSPAKEIKALPSAVLFMEAKPILYSLASYSCSKSAGGWLSSGFVRLEMNAVLRSELMTNIAPNQNVRINREQRLLENLLQKNNISILKIKLRLSGMTRWRVISLYPCPMSLNAISKIAPTSWVFEEIYFTKNGKWIN